MGSLFGIILIRRSCWLQWWYFCLFRTFLAQHFVIRSNSGPYPTNKVEAVASCWYETAPNVILRRYLEFSGHVSSGETAGLVFGDVWWRLPWKLSSHATEELLLHEYKRQLYNRSTVEYFYVYSRVFLVVFSTQGALQYSYLFQHSFCLYSRMSLKKKKKNI